MKSSGEKKIAMFFEQIKKDIFPEWDKKDEWRVKNIEHDSKHLTLIIWVNVILPEK